MNKDFEESQKYGRYEQEKIFTHYFLKDACRDLYFEYKMCFEESYGVRDFFNLSICNKIRRKWDAC